MRKTFDGEGRLDLPNIMDVKLNLECRDEMIPLLRGVQHLYSQPETRQEILALIGGDVNGETSASEGRPGLSYWSIFVLAVVRLGCDFNFDKLQDLAEQHTALRHIMGLGDWDGTPVNWRVIRDNLEKLSPHTIERINALIVNAGHALLPGFARKIRADAFVLATNIHRPTESSLIYDGMRHIIKSCVWLAQQYELPGWRQHQHLLKRIKELDHRIAKLGARKTDKNRRAMDKLYCVLLKKTKRIMARAREVSAFAGQQIRRPMWVEIEVRKLETMMARTQQVWSTAHRRVVLGETVPNSDKLFSVFETHTQLFKRGKAAEPLQYGRLVLVYEDALGFIPHYHLLPRKAHERDVVVEQTRILVDKLPEPIDLLSLDRGFHSPNNQEELAKMVSELCLPKPGKKQARVQERGSS